MFMRYLLFLYLLFLTLDSFSQERECLAFYNLENLFDTVDDTLINDQEYLPQAGWSEEMYTDKLEKMAKIIGLLGRDKGMNGASFIGLSEIENRRVLEDLLKTEALSDQQYQILHFDSPDRRGVDVAALYKVNRFTPLEAKSIIGLHATVDKKQVPDSEYPLPRSTEISLTPYQVVKIMTISLSWGT
jgi:hypothetical protein